MIKSMLVLSLLNIGVSSSYVEVETISHYQSNRDDKKLIFEFKSDVYSSHNLLVTIELYDKDDSYIISYQNEIDVIGSKSANAKFNCDEDEFYALIDIYYGEKEIVKDAKINFYRQDNCYLDFENYSCNRIFKSEYKDKISRDSLTNFKIKNDIFDAYLPNNLLDPRKIFFYSDYSFKDADISINIENNDYVLDVEGSGKYNFVLLEAYFVDVINYKFSDSYFSNSVQTNKIHLPFNEKKQFYKGKILIRDFIDIEINFSVYVSGNLLGKCFDSKFCLLRSSYD